MNQYLLFNRDIVSKGSYCTDSYITRFLQALHLYLGNHDALLLGANLDSLGTGLTGD
jgi:hypothetical protein